MINVGIVGTGFMAVAHIRAYRKVPLARIAALANPSGRNLDGDFSHVAGNVGSQDSVRLDMTQVRAYQRIDELLQDPDIAVIDICTPTHTHVDLCLAALAAGKHVLVEKPVARTSAEARRIAAAAAEAAQRGVFLMPALCIRFWPEYAWVKQAIAAGTYGRVLDARFRRVAQAPGWGHQHFLKGADSGGGLFDLHIHDTDFIVHCFGRPAAVTASGYSRVSGAVDHVMSLFHYPGGPTVSAEGSWAMTEGFGFNMAFTVNFERATVDFDIARGADALRLYAAGQSPATVKPDGGDGYIGEIRHFLESIAAKKAPTLVTPEDAATSIEVCEAEERSVQSGRTIDLA
jgi:predicted dehydrogenase